MKNRLACDTCPAQSVQTPSLKRLYARCLKRGWRISLGDKVMTDPETWPTAFGQFEKHHCPTCARRIKRLEDKIVRVDHHKAGA